MKYFENLETALENLTKRGAFLTTTSEDKTNTMTVSWGYVGYAWNRPIFIVKVRPQRYTLELLQKSDSFTISIPYSDDFKKALGVCGSKSGRDVNKEELANIKFINSKNVTSKVVENCDKYYECKITHIDKISSQNATDEIKGFYKQDDYHYLFYGEIVETY